MVGLLFLGGCMSVPYAADPASVSPPPTSSVQAASPSAERIATAAREMVGRRRLVVDGTRYNWDCTGVVLAAYHAAGADLRGLFAREQGNGVARLHALAEHAGGLDDLPKPGDILFFDDTYDRNGNGRWDDPLTHAAVVVAVTEGGDVYYVHHHYRLGVVQESFNLIDRDDPAINAAMRMRGTGGAETGRWLAGHLSRGFGSPYLLLGD